MRQTSNLRGARLASAWRDLVSQNVVVRFEFCFPLLCAGILFLKYRLQRLAAEAQIIAETTVDPKPHAR